jgi:hypothetical protein
MSRADMQTSTMGKAVKGALVSGGECAAAAAAAAAAFQQQQRTCLAVQGDLA